MNFAFNMGILADGSGYVVGFVLSNQRCCWARINYKGEVIGVEIYNESGMLVPEEKESA